MGLFSSILGGSPRNLQRETELAFARERKRLRRERITQNKEADKANTEGIGFAEVANFSFGDATDLEGLSKAERDMRSTGRIDTGLIL